MKSDEFLLEVTTSKYCPENFTAIYREFNYFQDATYKTLLEFHRVCEKNNIDYQLAFGSLLGIIRDGGQIPWDYDVDVFVSYEDKMRLVEALKKDLNENYYFLCPEIESSCRHVIMRLAPKGFRTEALHVDVFYYIPTSDDDIERKKHVALIKRYSDQRFYKLVQPREEASGDIVRQIKLYIKKLGVLFKTVEKISKDYEKSCNQYLSNTTLSLISADSFADWYTFPKRLFDKTVLIKVENQELSVSEHYHDMLDILYKDYKQYPPLKNRISEVIHHYQRLKYFGKKL